MPVRIYDISKKLGLENKEVLSKAKELGIAAARVASSSLDKITAEYLEQQLLLAHPERTAPPPLSPEAPAKASSNGPPAIAPTPTETAEKVKASETPKVTVGLPAQVEAEAPPVSPSAPLAPMVEARAPEPTPSAPLPASPVQETAAPNPPAQTPISPAPAPPPPPPVPLGPRLGDKVGFINLPPRPGAKLPEKPGAKLPSRPEIKRPEFGKRGDIRTVRGTSPPAGPPVPGTKLPVSAKGVGKPEPAAKINLPADAQVISIKPPIVVRELAEQLKQKPFKIIADLMELGRFASVNQSIEEPIAEKVCAKYGFRFEVEKRERGSGIIHAPVRKVELDVEDKPEDLAARAPVVTIMAMSTTARPRCWM